ncbi:MAG: CHASE2 domain-containing protein, partial [Gammaproteobacteria bacterium]|nr:CHASE2 domain-containing protein [Gammaproteobacteria bacterium]
MKRPLWTSHPVFVLLLAGLGLLGTYMHGVQALEGWVYDAAAGLLPLERPASTVAVAAVDEAALERFGPWPWSRARLAEALDRLRAGDARTVGLMVPLAEPQTPPDLPALRRRYNGGSAARALARLDTDGRLATAIARADNVVL